MIEEDESSKEGRDHENPRKTKRRLRSLSEYHFGNCLVLWPSKKDNLNLFSLGNLKVWALLNNCNLRIMLEIGDL